MSSVAFRLPLPLSLPVVSAPRFCGARFSLALEIGVPVSGRVFGFLSPGVGAACVLRFAPLWRDARSPILTYLIPPTKLSRLRLHRILFGPIAVMGSWLLLKIQM